MISIMRQLLNGSSKSLNVNGASVNVTFSYTASAPTESVNGIVCILKDEGNTAFSNFGALSALANGVLMQATQSGNTRTIATIKDNADLCMMFPQNQFGNGAVLSILAIVTPEGFGDTNNCLVGTLTFQRPILLASGDSISVVIQDNLSSIDVFQMSAIVGLD